MILINFYGIIFTHFEVFCDKLSPVGKVRHKAMTGRTLKRQTAKILMIEESRSALTVLTGLMRSLGFENLMSAATGEELIEKAVILRPDIIILENQLPDMKGTELAKKLRRNNMLARRSTPFVMLTSDLNLKTIERAREAGIDEFVAKPVSPKRFDAHLNEVLTNKRSFVEFDDYAGPCRRRRAEFSYAGPLKREEDKAFQVVNENQDIPIENILDNLSEDGDLNSNATLRQIYLLTEHALGIAKEYGDEKLYGEISTLLSYLRKKGQRNAVEASVILQHIEKVSRLHQKQA